VSKKPKMTHGPSENSNPDSSVDTVNLEKLENAHNAEKEKQNPETEGETAGTQSQTVNTGESRKRGRPPGSKNRPKEGGFAVAVSTIPPELIKLVVRAPYDMMANRRGEHWRLSEIEVTNMIPAHAALLERYLPSFVKENAALFAVISLHGMALYARIQIEMQLKKEEEKKEQEANVITGIRAFSNESSQDLPGQTRYGEVLHTSE